MTQDTLKRLEELCEKRDNTFDWTGNYQFQKSAREAMPQLLAERKILAEALEEITRERVYPVKPGPEDMTEKELAYCACVGRMSVLAQEALDKTSK